MTNAQIAAWYVAQWVPVFNAQHKILASAVHYKSAMQEIVSAKLITAPQIFSVQSKIRLECVFSVLQLT